MLLLVRLEICNHRRQFGVAIADFGKLLTIMAVNFGLHSHSAGHGRLRTDGGGHSAKCKASRAPNRVQGCWPHATLGHHLVKGVKVALLLLCHMRDAARGRRAVTHDRKLSGVNPFRAEFARLVDTNHAFDCQVPLRGGF